MKAEELNRLVASAELRNPKVFNASRERYIAEISFKAGIEAVFEWFDQECDCGNKPVEDDWDRWSCDFCREKKLKEWGIKV